MFTTLIALFFWLLSVSCEQPQTGIADNNVSIASTQTPMAFSQTASGDCKPNRGWCAGTYRGLTVGQSSYADMVRILGSPLSSGPEADQNDPKYFIWHDYGKLQSDFVGRLSIVTDKRSNKIVSILIAPDEMKKDAAINYFGPDYQTMTYQFCDGFENETATPVYEDPTATELRNIEYRVRGISISIDYRDRVNEISIVAEPPGLASKQECKAARRSK